VSPSGRNSGLLNPQIVAASPSFETAGLGSPPEAEMRRSFPPSASAKTIVSEGRATASAFTPYQKQCAWSVKTALCEPSEFNMGALIK
jgi:hypothetical protein